MLKDGMGKRGQQTSSLPPLPPWLCACNEKVSISARGGGGKLILFLFGKRERKVTHAKIRHLKKGNKGSEKMASDET